MLLRLVVNTSGGEMTTCVHRHYCLVKVFKVSQSVINYVLPTGQLHL